MEEGGSLAFSRFLEFSQQNYETDCDFLIGKTRKTVGIHEKEYTNESCLS